VAQKVDTTALLYKPAGITFYWVGKCEVCIDSHGLSPVDRCNHWGWDASFVCYVVGTRSKCGQSTRLEK